MTRGPSLRKRLSDGWMTIVARFGYVQTLMILTFFYATMIGVVGIGLLVARRDLLAKRELWTGGSAWMEADSALPDLERAKRLS